MKRILTILAVLTAGAMVGISLYYDYVGAHPAKVDAEKLMAALKSHADDLKGQGRPVPETVSLKDLIAQGRLAEADVPGFAGMDVTFSLGVDETQSQKEWITVRMPDGPYVVVLADGSVQQISASRIAAMRQQNSRGEK